MSLMTTLETAAETTAQVFKEPNISPKDWRKLLDVPVSDLLSIQSKLEPQYGSDTKKIINAYRDSRPNASAPDIFVAIASITMTVSYTHLTLADE